MRRWQKFGSSIVVACLVVTGLEWAGFSHYNQLLTGTAEAENQSAQNFSGKRLRNVQVLDDNPHLIALSERGDSLAYVDPLHTLHVIDLVNNKSVLDVPLTDTAVELDWIGEDSLFLGTETTSGGYRSLTLQTVSLDSGELRTIHQFSGVSQQSLFKAIAYSVFTNDVYVLIGNPSASAMYHFDTNGNISTIWLGGRVAETAAITSTTNALYFQAPVNGVETVFRYQNGYVSQVKSGARLLRALNDNVFLAVDNGSGGISRVDEEHDGQLSVFHSFAQPVPPDKLFVNTDGHVITITNNAYTDENTHKVTPLPQYAQVVVRNNAVFFFSTTGTVTVLV